MPLGWAWILKYILHFCKRRQDGKKEGFTCATASSWTHPPQLGHSSVLMRVWRNDETEGRRKWVRSLTSRSSLDLMCSWLRSEQICFSMSSVPLQIQYHRWYFCPLCKFDHSSLKSSTVCCILLNAKTDVVLDTVGMERKRSSTWSHCKLNCVLTPRISLQQQCFNCDAASLSCEYLLLIAYGRSSYLVLYPMTIRMLPVAPYLSFWGQDSSVMVGLCRLFILHGAVS